MDLVQWLLTRHYRDLAPPAHIDRYSLLKRDNNGHIIGKATGINYSTIAKNLNKAADSLERIDKVRKKIEEACKKNPNGLPF